MFFGLRSGELIPLALLGVGHSGARKFRGDRPPERIAKALVLLASGVGNNPDSVAPVRGANGESWYAIPPEIIPERGQGPENLSKSSTKERCDVFQNEVLGSPSCCDKLANQSDDFPEEARASAVKPSPGTRVTEVLAGESSTDDIDGKSI
jgi:hypothetical protein